jgi:hypothetical protein
MKWTGQEFKPQNINLHCYFHTNCEATVITDRCCIESIKRRSSRNRELNSANSLLGPMARFVLARDWTFGSYEEKRICLFASEENREVG